MTVTRLLLNHSVPLRDIFYINTNYFLYEVLVLPAPSRINTRVYGALRRSLFWFTAPHRLLTALTDPTYKTCRRLYAGEGSQA